ncbi:MAG: 2-C-methyl-D-erythritol 2,4-cyclodiphosphate synthase [Bacilli bacterium]|nr:2-C-methyl-D-erythritol 2,4-cyclodiphosphate synthase [Bacilli bacterium]
MADKLFRIGLGEDIHRLIDGNEVILAGVHIPFNKKLLGHSDADVVFHAVSDAILGALALGDIGKHFPTDDPEWEGADSSRILSRVVNMMLERGYSVSNLDVSICCEEPHLSKHILAMRENLAKLLRVSIEETSVKALTNEGIDATGEGKAIRANAIVLLTKAD